jgi:pyruvate,water dikinase
MQAVSDRATPGTTPDFERALAAIEEEFAVAFTSTERVEAACAVLRREAGDWTRVGHVAGALRVLPLVHRRTGPFTIPLVALLREAGVAAASWPILAGLLEGRDVAVSSALLDDAAALAEAGRLAVGLDVAQGLADLSDRDDSPLARPELLEKVARLLRQVPRGVPAGPEPSPPAGTRPQPAPSGQGAETDPVVALYVGASESSLRRLAARVLDLAGQPPEPELAASLLGSGAPALLPLLAYTRASHLDVADLVGRPGDIPEIAEPVGALEGAWGRGLAGDVVGELGWRRANLGLEVQHVVGVSVDESLPFLLTPVEADLLSGDPGARRVFERIVAIGHGGTCGRTERGDGGDDVIQRFRAYNLEHAEVLADILGTGPLTVERVRGIFARMDRITRDFVGLFADRSDECAVLPGLYAALKSRIETEMQGAVTGRPLSVELTRLVQMFEDPPSLAGVRTLHGLKRYLHQRGLALGFGLLEARQGTNRTLDVVLASPERVLSTTRRLEYVDFEATGPSAGDPRQVPYAVRIVADGFVRQLLYGQASLPRVRVFCYGNEVHYFVYFKNHPVFIRIDYSPPLGGGMIDLAYYGVSKYELDAHPGLALEGIQAFFRRLDFLVEVENTRIKARYDKERARDLTDLCEKAEALFRLVPYLMDVDWIVGDLDLPEDGRRAVGVAWADLFARWGTLPVAQLLTDDRTGILLARELRPEGAQQTRWLGRGPYADVTSGRPRAGFAACAHAAFAARGFEVPLVERERELGQIALEGQLLRPLRDAIARGELVVDGEGLHRAPPGTFEREHEADRLARVLASDGDTLRQSARLARLATALERTLRFETTSTVDGYEVQRAWLALRGQRAALFALRDGAGIFRLALFARDGAVYRHRVGGDPSWRDSVTCDVGEVAALLRRNNFLPSWIDAAPHDERLEIEDLRAAFQAPNPRPLARPLAGERVVAGVRASPGRAAGLVRLGTRGRRPDDLKDGVLFASTLSPDDSAFLYHAAAVVATGGGILSHAGLMAVQYGRPALIVAGEWREQPDGAASIAYRRLEFDERRRRVDGREVVERCNVREFEERLREGDLVVVDADEGTLHVFGQAQAALALHDSLHDFDAASRRLERASAPPDVLVERGRRLHALHQLERLAARLEVPAIVQHAVRELLTGAPSGLGLGRGGRREKARLLALLRARPGTGALVADAILRVAHEVADRHAAARREALRLIPSARTLHEVLTLRLATVRMRAALDDIADFLKTAGVGAPPAPVEDDGIVDTLAGDRIAAVVDTMRARIGAIDTPAWAPGVRHDVQQLASLVQCVGVPDRVRTEVEACCQAVRDHDAARTDVLSSRLVLWPEDGGLEIGRVAGMKAANLAELARLGVGQLVPAWFVVTDRAFQDVLAARLSRGAGGAGSRPGPSRTLGQAIDATIARDDLSPEEKAAHVRQLWADVPLPASLEAEVIGAYGRLASTAASNAGADDGGEPSPDACGAGPLVAIRSSAREEDTAAATAAGEFDTFLFVRGAGPVVAHLRRAWSGLWTARAIHDRAAGGRAGRGEGGGVIVQRIAWSRVSGVLQTTNVAEGRTREMVVNVGLGLGEGVVSGLVAADHVVVSKDEDPEVEPLRFRYVTADKRERVVFDARSGAGTLRVAVLAHQRLRAALEYTELVDLVRAATRLEAAYGYPLDIEFGFEGARLRLLQVRPVPGTLAVWHETRNRYPLRSAGAGSREPGTSETVEVRHDPP